VCWCGVALALAGVVVVAPRVGAKAPVVASGSIQCTSWTGKAKFAPPLVNGAAGTSTVSVSGTLSGCSDSAGVTTGKVTASATLPTDCTQDLNPSQSYNLGSIGFRIKWHGSGKFADTYAGSLTDGLFSQNGPQALGTAGFLFIDGIDPSANGSFISSQGGILADATSTETIAQLGVNCTPKTKGQAGTGGLKKLAMASGEVAIGP
jgi:hypothetical protein